MLTTYNKSTLIENTLICLVASTFILLRIVLQRMYIICLILSVELAGTFLAHWCMHCNVDPANTWSQSRISCSRWRCQCSTYCSITMYQLGLDLHRCVCSVQIDVLINRNVQAANCRISFNYIAVNKRFFDIFHN